VTAASALLLSGCVSRALVIESDPPGAEVRLNGTPVGRTPAYVPFRHYGIYRVELSKEGFGTLLVEEPVLAPLYARFPACLLTELILPWRIRDERYLSYDLSPEVAPDREGLLKRAAAAESGAGE
jgi:hypothetical protein